MEIRWLEGFIAVAEELHFSNAAARLDMQQSPLSQLIRRLEKELGQRLFDRSTRSVELTAAGQAFLPHAREIVARTIAARQAVDAAEGEIVGRVRVGFSGVLNYSTLPPLTRMVHERLPHVHLDLVGRILTRDALIQLQRGSLDLSFVGLPVNNPDVATRLINKEAFGVVLPADHPLAGEEIVHLGDLSGDGFVTTPESSGSVFRDSTLKLCAEAGFTPRISQEVTDPYVAMLLVAEGVGVAVMTEGVGPLTPPGSVYRPIRQDSVELSHGVAWVPGAGTTARDAVIEIAEELSAPTGGDGG